MKFLHILYFIIATLFITSCSDDFLDKQPLDQITSSNFYRTEEDAKKALVSVYDALQYQSTPGVSWSPFIVVSDQLSDDCYAGGADANDGLDENELNTFNTPTTNAIVHSLWLKNYTGIYRANLLLEQLDNIEASAEFKDRVTAECKFLRAYFYFELVRFFENIPLLTNTAKGPSEYNQPQAPVQDVYNQIAADLVDAIAVLPETVPSVENGRITKWGASGLLARVFLYHDGVYGTGLTANGQSIGQTEALNYLEDMISNGDRALLPDYGEIFKLAGEFSSESVLEISHADSPAWWDWGYLRGSEGNLAAQMQGPRVTGSEQFNRGWSFCPVSEKLVKDLENDPRFEHTILTEGELDGNLVKGYQHTGYFSKKYTSDAEHWGSDGQFEHNRTCNNRVIRYSDVLLMAAELGSPNAQQYLDDVRERVGLSSIPATKENILKERRLELSLEGIRYFDVLRQGLSVAQEELSLDIRGPLYTDDQVVYTVTFNNATKGLLPIPQTEIDLSAGTFQQNAGY